MKELRLKLLDNGSVIKRENSVIFDFENESAKVGLNALNRLSVGALAAAWLKAAACARPLFVFTRNPHS